ncbi:MAG: hypothetical protein JW778_01570 [Candidatus Altiarchaeota archaeon]|nr:hypothetical protein [Candidatus Altiarchaeota archaeon]
MEVEARQANTMLTAFGSILLAVFACLLKKHANLEYEFFIATAVITETFLATFTFLGWVDPARFQYLRGYILLFLEYMIQGNMYAALSLLYLISAMLIVAAVGIIYFHIIQPKLTKKLNPETQTTTEAQKTYMVIILSATTLATLWILASLIGVTSFSIYDAPMNPLQKIVYTITVNLTGSDLYGILSPSNVDRILESTEIPHLYATTFTFLCILYNTLVSMGENREIQLKPIITAAVTGSIVGILTVASNLLGPIGGGTGILITAGFLSHTYRTNKKIGGIQAILIIGLIGFTIHTVYMLLMN